MIKIVLVCSIIITFLYFVYRVQVINFTPWLLPFSILLFVAEMHTIIHLYGMIYSLWPRIYFRFKKININKNLRINIFICVSGETPSIVKETVTAAKKTVDYYTQIVRPFNKPQIIILNDGLASKRDNWSDIQLLAKDQGVKHIARKINTGFKAGNINNGLRKTPTLDPHNTLDIVFDSDFAAKNNFLLEITKPFVDNTIDFVQTPQRYKNEKSWVAQAAAAHQIFFFDYICPSKSYDNALFLCGTNFAIRRSALNSVGGMDERFITEDYATSLNLHLKGKKGVFIPEVLAEGIAPSTLKAYYNQQRRWSKGSFDVSFTYLKQLLFGSLTLKQKFHYLLSATYYLIGMRDLILILAPIPYLFFGISLIKAKTLTYLFLIYLPFLIFNFSTYIALFKHPIKSLVLDIVSFPIYATSFFFSLLKKNLSFVVTIKKYQSEDPYSVYKIQIAIASILLFGIAFNYLFQINKGVGSFINNFWAGFDVFLLCTGFYLILREHYQFGFKKQFNENIIERTASVSTKRTFNFYSSILTFAFGVVMLLFLSPLFVDMFAFWSNVQKIIVVQKTPDIIIPNNGVYYGYFYEELNKHPSNPKIGLYNGDQPSLTMFYQDWTDETKFDTLFINSLSEQNIIPIITWEPWNAKLPRGPDGYSQPEYAPKVISSGKYDKYIRSWAKDVANYKKPIFIRLAHEMNGNWYAWGNVSGNTPDDYKKMWIHIHNIFKEERADNVKWVWSPNNTDEYGNSDSIMDYYPGDQYVDWVGFSGFNWGYSSTVSSWLTFKDITENTYNILVKINKPIMVAETSSVSMGGDKVDWFENTLNEDLPYYNKIKAVIFYDNDFNNSDFRISNDPKVVAAMKSILENNKYYIKTPLLGRN